MCKVLFIGPISTSGGPAIKNRILIDHLKKNISIRVWNTYNKSIRKRLGAIFNILFTQEEYIIIAVSRKGRKLLYPVLLLKHKVSNCKYSCVIIGGQVIESVKSKVCIDALHHASVVTVETIGLKNQIEKAFHLKNVHWMPNYKELNETITVKEELFSERTLHIIFLSSMRNLKGVRTLLESFKMCKEHGYEIELDYFGPIKNDLDKTVINEIEATEGVRYCGTVSNDNVLRTMICYQLFVFPTEHPTEGFPAVLVEAQSVGLPIIASDINYNPEIIEDGKNGYIFEHGNTAELSKKIEYCCEHRNELIKISRSNIQKAKQYDAALVIEKYVSALKKSGWSI